MVRRVVISSIAIITLVALSTNNYIRYKTTLKSISKSLESLDQIRNSEKRELPPMEILYAQEELIREYFVDKVGIETLIYDTKKALTSSGLSVPRYSINTSAIQFSFNGDLSSFYTFIQTLRSQPLYRSIKNLSFKSLDSRTITGNLEIWENVIEQMHPRIVRQEMRQLQKETGEIFKFIRLYGEERAPNEIKLDEPISKEAVDIVEIPQVALNRQTNKFTFIGEINGNSESVTLFKETQNDRVYQFAIGESISEWTYIGLEGNIHLFENKGERYEVIN